MACQEAVRKCYSCLGMKCIQPWKNGGLARYLVDPSRLPPPCPASCRFRLADDPSPALAKSGGAEGVDLRRANVSSLMQHASHADMSIGKVGVWPFPSEPWVCGAIGI